MAKNLSTFCALVALLAPLVSHAKIHDLKISSDNRKTFSIETFGFVEGGTADITVKAFQVSPRKPGQKIGFIIRKTESEGDLALEDPKAHGCLMDEDAPGTIVVDMTDPKTWKEKTVLATIKAGEEGLYRVLFTRCWSDLSLVSFELQAKLYNPGPSYLSAGEAPLPSVYLAFALAFAALTALWVVTLRKHREKVHTIHHMMLVLVVFKTCSVLFHSISFHFIKTGGSGAGWATLYLVFAFLKGIILFVTILLIGTGWSLLKPFLSDREKKILMVVLTLQVIDNIAMVVLQETAPGSQGWLTWNDLLHLIDIVCCCAVLFPIVWSIRALRQAQDTDGKAARNVARLTQFRGFYVCTVSYIYFTRIVVYFLAATLPFTMLWLRFFFAEAATLTFFSFTGWKFRPQADNPYLRVDMEDSGEEDDDFGLSEEGGVQMTAVAAAAAAAEAEAGGAAAPAGVPSPRPSPP